MSTSTLALQAEILVRPRNATKKTPCPPAAPHPSDRHQQPGFLNQHRYAYRTCISSTGRTSRRSLPVMMRETSRRSSMS